MKSKRKVRWDSDGIRALRVHLGMTQQELADELGTRQQTVSEWETGMYRPRGASATLLSIIAERASYNYVAAAEQEHAGGDVSKGFEVIVNNAGIRKDAVLAMMKESEWHDVLEVRKRGQRP